MPVSLWHLNRLIRLCRENNVRVMLDAELHSMHYMEQAIALALMKMHNGKSTGGGTIAYATFQHIFRVTFHRYADNSVSLGHERQVGSVH